MLVQGSDIIPWVGSFVYVNKGGTVCTKARYMCIDTHFASVTEHSWPCIIDV